MIRERVLDCSRGSADNVVARSPPVVSAVASNATFCCTVFPSQPPQTKNKVLFVDYMEISASCCGPFAATALNFPPTGTCTFVDTVTGVEKEEGQDRLSVQVRRYLMYVSFLVVPAGEDEWRLFCTEWMPGMGEVSRSLIALIGRRDLSVPDQSNTLFSRDRDTALL